jgi:hypothetical protein
MKRVNKIVDRIVFALVSRRLARFRRRGDPADTFADALIAALTGEMARRNRLIDGWEAERRRADAAAMRGERIAYAIEQFKSFESENSGLKLQ